MTWEALFVFGLVAVAGVAMASGRVRMDVTAFLVRYMDCATPD